MHRKQPIAVMLYNCLYPNPRPNVDPATFSQHLSKHLVPEVRIETATFYGSLDTIEARYPGLNYSHPPHRKRLGRFPHHANLFRAFDELGLTEGEIAGFCRWEGTKWARERYERDEGIKVQDTTGLDIPEWVDPRKTKKAKIEATPKASNSCATIHVKQEMTVEIEQFGHARADTGSSDEGSMNNDEHIDLDELNRRADSTRSMNEDPVSNNDRYHSVQDPAMAAALVEQMYKDAAENGTDFSQISQFPGGFDHRVSRTRLQQPLPSMSTLTANQFQSTTNQRTGSPRA
ncbi:MAG: hypothetical protein M1820_005799 [Bogoriella megaspora]|nr:MAG: hypothetical protein M1820_005799 [Bogoriella megaspora]